MEHFMFAKISEITPENLASLLKCKLTDNSTSFKETWKLFFTKVSGVLDKALSIFSNMSMNISKPVMSDILDVIGDIRINIFSGEQLMDVNFTNYWFHGNLRPFLSSASGEFLSCLSNKNITCEIYQNVYVWRGFVNLIFVIMGHTVGLQLKEFNNEFLNMDPWTKTSVYTYLIYPFLSKNTTDLACLSNTNDSMDWLLKNFGNFSVIAPLTDLLALNEHFSPMDALPLLSVSQLAEVAYTPGQLTSSEDANNLMGHISNAELHIFFDQFSSAIQGEENRIPPSVRSAMLQQAFMRANLSEPSVSDTEVLLWLQLRLRPLLINMSVDYIEPYFTTVQNRSCTTVQQAVELLYSIQSTLSDDTQKKIYSNIVTLLKEPSPIRCYQNNSFYSFMESSFLGFQFPNLSTFLSLVPDTEKSMLINSMSPSDLGSLLSRPNIVDNSSQLCTIFNYYFSTPDFLEKENVSDSLRQQILPCVWPMALSSKTKTDVEVWFNSLSQYMKFLNKDLIGSPKLLSASCLSFQKFVFVLGNGYNYSNMNFNKGNVYTTIKDYLSTGTKPKCYNATNPDLNSTAWFVDYIGEFINFTTLDDLNSFGSTQLQVFAPNLANIHLFNQTGFQQNISSFYTELIYLQDPNFNPLLLPMEFRCSAPGSSYTQLNNEEAMTVLRNISHVCTEVDPQIITANSAPQALLINVPDAMADEISRSLLTNFTSDTVTIQRINTKKWKPEQAVLFFHTVADAMSDPNNISADVLQGFTCSRVQAFTKNKVINLIKACRNNGEKKIVLQETQLTCMYNCIKDGNASAFTQYPSDILLYYKQLSRKLPAIICPFIQAGCTTGNITAVTISDEAFPFGYDAIQFNACLTADVVKANLAALADKVVDDGFLTIILNKLNQAYNSSIADEQVQQLGSISRVASLADINKWNITKIDTLAALMSSSDGKWTPDQSNLIITKYLSTKGNTLGTAELNSIGGVNLCALNASVLNTISSSSLRYADVLDVSNCSTSNKVILFTIANSFFSSPTNISLTSYQLIQPYIGGAPLSYVKLLSTSNVSMDIPTFASLDPNVIMALTVSDVKGLLGNNLADLKTYENVTVIQNWTATQYKSVLDTLGLNLIGGRADLTTTVPGLQNSTGTTVATIVSTVMTATPTTKTPTTSAYSKIH
ncbi:Mesothelin-like protein-like [Scleropages formosus]|uniref:Mesothelin-like protein-like n=1 Tax=Scleropages formosus TaxID=113540 RepID=A0A0P7XA77_SCLFO|nr:Mesothelin-like protein-like [Scleropages formosus]